MGKSLRSLLKAKLLEESLRDYFGETYETTPEDVKNKLADFTEGQIDRRVDSILNAFINEVQSGSPEKKRKEGDIRQ